MKTKKKQNGFSLIEIILATLASSMVILIVATILLMAYWSWRTNNAFATLRRDSAFATHILAADIRASLRSRSISPDTFFRIMFQ